MHTYNRVASSYHIGILSIQLLWLSLARLAVEVVLSHSDSKLVSPFVVATTSFHAGLQRIYEGLNANLTAVAALRSNLALAAKYGIVVDFVVPNDSASIKWVWRSARSMSETTWVGLFDSFASALQDAVQSQGVAKATATVVCDDDSMLFLHCSGIAKVDAALRLNLVSCSEWARTIAPTQLANLVSKLISQGATLPSPQFPSAPALHLHLCRDFVEMINRYCGTSLVPVNTGDAALAAAMSQILIYGEMLPKQDFAYWKELHAEFCWEVARLVSDYCGGDVVAEEPNGYVKVQANSATTSQGVWQ